MGADSRKTRWLPVSLAAIGFLFSAYLEYLHVRTWLDPSLSSVCTVAKAADCNAVALSNWSSVLGVPLPLWGLAGFWTLAVAAWQRSRWLLPLAAFAAVASVGMLAIELLLVGSVCLFCEVVHVASWVLVWVAWQRRSSFTAPYRDTHWLAFGLAPAGGILLATLVAVPPYWRVPTWQSEPPLPHGITSDGHHWIGSESPTLTVEEWVDYNCPHCKASSQRTLRALTTKGSKVRVIRRNYPRMNCSASSPTSCLALRTALCAAKQNRFWQMDRWLFAHWDKARVNLDAAAADVRMDAAALKSCVVDPATYKAADDESRSARKARIIDTPSYRIDGKKVKELDAYLRIKDGK